MYYCGNCIWDGCPDKAYCDKQHEAFTQAQVTIRDIEDDPLRKMQDKSPKPKGRKRHVSGVHKRS